jgi:decaprenyl-phosphate phosphoribosyltransferase
MNALIRTARPKQWTKNVLVFAAPGAAGVLDEPRQLGLTCLAFVAMCLASSGTYYWNDALDIESDREHPTKRFRPIASGLVSLRTAHIVGTTLMVAALAVAATTGRWQTVGVVALYLAVTLSYSVIWKHIAVVDLVAIASGFVLRAAAGAVAVDVPMSSWFVLCITFGSLFIVTGKRFAESRELGEDAHKLRSTLGDYSEGFLRFVLALACGGALVSYCMWAFERRDLVDATNHFYELSIVPVLTAFLRYALTLEQGRGAAPEEVFASDRVLQVLGLLWVIVFGLAVYTG